MLLRMDWAWAARTGGVFSNCSTAEEPLAEGEGCQHAAGARDLLGFRHASGQSDGERSACLTAGAGQGSASSRGQPLDPPSPPQWKSGPVVSLGWSAEEELLCVQEDGVVLVYGLHGDFRRHFSMGNVGPQGAGGEGWSLCLCGSLNLRPPFPRRCSRTGF